MRYVARLEKLEARLNPGRVIVIPQKVALTASGLESVAHPERLETTFQRYLDNGGVIPADRDLVVLVSKFT